MFKKLIALVGTLACSGVDATTTEMPGQEGRIDGSVWGLC